MAWYTAILAAYAGRVTANNPVVEIATFPNDVAKTIRESDTVRLLGDCIVPLTWHGSNVAAAKLATHGKDARGILWSNVVTRAARYDGRYPVKRDAAKLERMAKAYAGDGRVTSEIKARTPEQAERLIKAYVAAYVAATPAKARTAKPTAKVAKAATTAAVQAAQAATSEQAEQAATDTATPTLPA